MILGSASVGTAPGGVVTSTEVVVTTTSASGFGLPDDPLVLPALTRPFLFLDLDKRPEGTKVINDMVVD